ncbi:NAD(P)H-dependent oxidoreductase [Litoribrevibacter albus]|uniref:NAD(P)H dehydrogenase (Quinone) n=1 Tax=Litoribrevibacter albus TaxID=1473156 RepID=A0AA37W9F3_9GAMM|nr:NAD(P)H-dependent oxidoreductase [Litoribrevibacter albus]GLQ32576.1 NAD(P)H dehydrogenase (quinone) [Litoribrevibacter albus]
MMKTLLINANPKVHSFSLELANAYEAGATQISEVRRFNLSDMSFNSSLDTGYDAIQPLEPCLKEFQDAVLWADHLVIVSPIWWGGLPAKFKGLLDRTFLPGVAFKFEEDNPEPIPLLAGKTAHLVLTMDAPDALLEFQAAPVLEQLDRFTLKFCGVETTQCTLLGSVIMSDETQRQTWLDQVSSEARSLENRVA